ncbi:MAG: glycosyltransferase [Candidatus Methylacidiphilales bacterium]
MPRPTGVQRVVRGLVLEMARRGSVLPLVWQSSLGSYCRLTPNQLAHLRGWSLLPWEHSLTGALSRNLQFLGNRMRQVDLSRVLKPGDHFIQPEIFQDERIEWVKAHFPNWQGIRKSLVFYDALNWSHPHLSASGRITRFTDYLNTCAQFDRVVPISDFSDQALKTFWRDERITPAPSRVIQPVLGWSRRPRLKSDGDRLMKIPYVATLEPRKNHLALMEACGVLWDEGHAFELILVGKEGPGQGKQIAAKIRNWTEAGKPLRWLAGLSDRGVKRLYRQASFTVYPSLVEGFGLPILESLWFGAPCLCHHDGAVAETARGGGCHLVDVRHVDSLAAGIRSLLTDKALRTRLSNEAASRSFPSWAEYVNAWEQDG